MNLLSRNSLLDLNDMFENLYSPATTTEANTGFFSPRVDINDKEGCYEIVADLPGVDKKDLKVTLENDVLTIEASTEEETTEEQQGRVIRKERRSGKFLRSFNLDHNIQEAEIKASFKNGVLSLEVPKVKEVAQQRKKIAIH